MAHSPPPVPPEQRSHKGPGSDPVPGDNHETKSDPAGGNVDVNFKEQGRYGGIAQNVNNQGQHQDR